MVHKILLALAIALLFSACGKKGQGTDNAENKTGASVERPLLISSEDLITLSDSDLASGPVITGSVQPERRADLRAEISAVVLQALKENGESVKRGDLLVRLDDTAIRDSMMSAEAAARAAAQTYDQAERQFERLKTLRASGMASLQQLEDAEIRRNNAQSDLVAARARAVQARQQLQRTEVRAPFDGVISERKVSAGDTAQIGKELLKVIDPSSMRFEGFVSADRISSVKVGQPVHFRVNGYGQQEFNGTVRRVDPAANPVTRQVEVLVGFSGGEQPRVSGLYAEGRVEAGSSRTLMIPESALMRNGDKAYAWRVKGNALNKIELGVGERDSRRGDFVVRSGLAAGDKVLRNPISTLKDGQKIEIAASSAAMPVSTSASKAAAAAASGK